MKKKLVGVIIVSAVIVAAGWNFNRSKKQIKLSELGLANVEALARGESATDACDDFTTMHCTTIIVTPSGSQAVTYDNMYPVDAL